MYKSPNPSRAPLTFGRMTWPCCVLNQISGYGLAGTWPGDASMAEPKG